MTSELYSPVSLTDIIPGSKTKILGIEEVNGQFDEDLIDSSRFREKPPILTYEDKEFRMAQRSLWNEIGITYLGVLKNSTEEKALEVTHSLLYDVANYGVCSLNVLESLQEFRGIHTPNAKQLEAMKTHHAPAIEIGRYLQRVASQDEKNIPKDSVYWYKKARAIEDTELAQYLNYVIHSHQYRIIFWKNEFEDVANHPVVGDLLDAITSSNPIEK